MCLHALTVVAAGRDLAALQRQPCAAREDVAPQLMRSGCGWCHVRGWPGFRLHSTEPRQGLRLTEMAQQLAWQCIDRH